MHLYTCMPKHPTEPMVALDVSTRRKQLFIHTQVEIAETLSSRQRSFFTLTSTLSPLRLASPRA